MATLADRPLDANLQLLHATMRVNTAIFCLILGLITGILLFALAVAAVGKTVGHAGLLVALIGVFLPFYEPSAEGALAGLVWGSLIGATLGGGIYRINCRHVLDHVDQLVAMRRGNGDFPLAVLRLHGPSLGLAIGTIGALGLLATTNWLVLRGTAEESIHAKLLSQVLPGYDVSLPGSIIGAAEFFVAMYVLCIAFAHIYNRVVAIRHHQGGEHG